MSAVQPQQQDPTRGMSLVSNVNPDREQTRYVFTAGQFLDPERVFQMEHIREAGGGEEVQTHCFRRTPGGFLPRGRLTPMETWVDHLPAALIGEGLEGETVHIQGPMTTETLGMQRRPGMLLGKPLSNVKFYPGDEINSVLRANQGKGLVEVRALKGVSWYKDEAESEPGLPQTLNGLFFPFTPPPTLRALRERIQQVAAEQAVSTLVQGVSRDMLTSCDQFERWAQTILAAEHTLLRQRTKHEHTYTYSPVARELLRQLEMKPQDNILEQASIGGMSAEQFAEVLSKYAPQGGGGMGVAEIAAIAAQVAREVLAAQQRPAGDTEASDTSPEQGETKTDEPKAAEAPTGQQPDDAQPVPRRKRQE